MAYGRTDYFAARASWRTRSIPFQSDRSGGRSRGSIKPTSSTSQSIRPKLHGAQVRTMFSSAMWRRAEKLGGVDLLLADIGMRLTGHPWRAIPMTDADPEDPRFSNMEGQERAGFGQFDAESSME